jgi:hypothetical protein
MPMPMPMPMPDADAGCRLPIALLFVVVGRGWHFRCDRHPDGRRALPARPITHAERCRSRGLRWWMLWSAAAHGRQIAGSGEGAAPQPPQRPRRLGLSSFENSVFVSEPDPTWSDIVGGNRDGHHDGTGTAQAVASV